MARAFGAIAEQGVAKGVKELGTDEFKTANATSSVTSATTACPGDGERGAGAGGGRRGWLAADPDPVTRAELSRSSGRPRLQSVCPSASAAGSSSGRPGSAVSWVPAVPNWRRPSKRSDKTFNAWGRRIRSAPPA